MKTRAAAALCLLAFCFPAVVARAQEPTYTVTLPDKNVLRVRTESTGAPMGGHSLRVVTLGAGYAVNDFSLDARVLLAADGLPQRAALTFGPKAVPELVNLAAERVGAAGSEQAFHVSVPERRGTIPVGAGRLATLSVVQMAVGRIYDWQRGGEQSLPVLLDIGVLTPQLSQMTLVADGAEEIDLKAGKVKARRLRYDAPFAFLPEAARKGHLYVGKRGEVLRWDGVLFGQPYKLKAPATKDETTGELRVAVDAPGDLVLKETPRPGGDRAFVLGAQNGDFPIATTVTRPDLRPVSVESPFFGRPFKAVVVGTELRYTLAATPPKRTPTPGGRAWFAPQFFAPGVWEAAGPFAGMEPGGEKRNGVYFPLFTGQEDGNPFVLERLADARANGPAGPATVRRYRMAAKVTHDLYTDGKHLLAMLSSDGTRIVRGGWEAFAEAQTAPPTPAPPAEQKPSDAPAAAPAEP